MGTSICSVNYFCFGAVLIFLGSVLFCALGFTIVLPYEATRDWPQTTCHVINSSYHSHLCSCDRQPTFDLDEFDTCVGKYPCLQIYVWFKVVKLPLNESITVMPLGEGLLNESNLTTERQHRSLSYTSHSDSMFNSTTKEQGQTIATTVYASAKSTEETAPDIPSHFPAQNRANRMRDGLVTDKAGHTETQTRSELHSTEFNDDSQASQEADFSTETSNEASSSIQISAGVTFSNFHESAAITLRQFSKDGEAVKREEAVTYTGLLFRAWTDAFYKQVNGPIKVAITCKGILNANSHRRFRI